jgi:phosphoglycolate phosphatase
MFKLIIFDFDGVIADTFELHYQTTLKFIPNATREELMAHSLNNPIEKPVIKFKKEDFEPYFELFSKNFTKELFFPVKQMIDELSKIYPLVIVSSTGDEAVEHAVELGGFKNDFKKIYGMNTHTSKIEKFKMIFRDFGVTSDECIFITDTIGDIKEAKHLEIKTIAVTWGFHNREVLETAKPFAIIDTIEQLEKYIS